MKLRANPEGHAPKNLAVTAMGVLGLSGGATSALAVLLPPNPEGSVTAVLVLGAVSAIVGGVMLVRRPNPGQLSMGALTVLGTALITVAAKQAGVGGGGSADAEIIYLWVILYAFYFLQLPNALFQTAVVGGAYGWLLVDAGVGSPVAQWTVTMTSLTLAGGVTALLRANLYSHVNDLSDRASRDGLTGLLNRSSLDERFAIERERSRRDSAPLSVLVIDIDEFKALNDTLGHPTGDEVLRQVGSALRHWTRKIDAAARVGGDEFAVLLPGADASGAVAVAEDLRSAIARSLVPGEVRTTVSIGVTTATAPAPDFGELWQAADAAMYEAKRSGGDRVVYREAGQPAETVPTTA